MVLQQAAEKPQCSFCRQILRTTYTKTAHQLRRIDGSRTLVIGGLDGSVVAVPRNECDAAPSMRHQLRVEALFGILSDEGLPENCNCRFARMGNHLTLRRAIVCYNEVG